MSLNKISVKKMNVFSPPIIGELKDGGRIMMPTGELTQIVNGKSFKFLAYIEFDNDTSVVRGNHYHLVKEEHLYLIRGRLQAVYKDIDTEEMEELVLEAGDLIVIKPRCAHVYFPLEYSQSVEFSPSEFDANDTYRYVIS